MGEQLDVLPGSEVFTMRSAGFLAGFLVAACVGFGHLGADDQTSAKASAPVISFSLLDLRGTSHSLDQNDGRRVRVYVFLSTHCPVSNGYIQTLNTLHARFSDQPVDLFGVLSDASVTRAEAVEHFREFKAAFTILFDSSGLLLQALQPTHVPEAMVLGRNGQLVYRGAIDNAWEALGRRRPRAEKEFVAEAVTATLNNQPPVVTKTQPIGCLIESVEPGDSQPKVTYTRDIAPIVQARCLNCHREGQVAPFPLADYEQTAKRAGQIVRVTQDRIMPPWIPSPGHDKFVGERWLTNRELELFETWEQTGRVRGDDADLPPAPKFAEGWQLGQPDLIVKMPQPFEVPADGPDLLQNFVIPLDIPEDKLVAAMEFHPGNKRVCHHSVLFLDSSGQARKLDKATPEPGYANFGGPGFLPSGALGGWSVGNTPRPLPNGMGRYLKKGSDLVVQMHYHPTGKAETDQSEIGLYFVNKPVAESLREPAKLVGSIWMANYEMDIPAGEQHYARSTSYTLPREVILVGVVPHMHLLGKAMKVTATLPDQSVKVLIDVQNWNYNWQDEYYYERPFKLPAGTRLHVDAIFDNSAENPSNPSSPPRRVTWGDGTTDEMLFCFFLLSAEKTEDLIHVIFDNLKHDTNQPRKVVQK
jgi:peroxiredoxin